MKKQTFVVLFIIMAAQFCQQCNTPDSSHATVQSNKTTAVKKDSLAFGDKNWVSNGLIGKVYLLAENTGSLPDFDTMRSMTTLYTTSINIPERSWETGFPGLPNRFEWFAIQYKGNFKVNNAGHYTFRLLSDDGSKLYIDNRLIIDNDGTHPAYSRTGETDLDKSNHSIIIQYFQGPRYEIALQLFASYNKEDEQLFPGKYFVLSTPGYDPLIISIIVAVLLIVLILIIIYYRHRLRRRSIAE